MKRHVRLIPLAGSIALLAALGCGSSPTSPTPVSQSVADDLAMQFASSVGAPDNGLSGEFGLFSIAFPSGPRPTRPEWRTTSTDTVVTVGTVTYTLSYTFYDVDGVALSGWSPAAVRLAWSSRATGDVTAPQWTASLRRSSLFDVTGIQDTQDTVVVDGSVRDTIQSTFTSLDQARTRHLYSRGALTLARVAALKDTTMNPYPLGGTLAWSVHVQRLRSNSLGDVEATYDAEVTVQFNGTRYPTVTVARVFRYSMDLDTGAVVRLPA